MRFPMDETMLTEELLSWILAGEFDGRLYETILSLSKDELQQIVTLGAAPPSAPVGESMLVALTMKSPSPETTEQLRPAAIAAIAFAHPSSHILKRYADNDLGARNKKAVA